ncbi:transcriptional regulator [Actinoplanes lutulentus]|uniref:Transcriptional regulator n=1 Tax=Actinoplanes lutulentus TaxID=1287878 RepID=A0A327ZHE7_9ACTN|nr:BTAD domain-containing putative transcriptional regulator [Actinoplanes lutulentus]RAK35551.1 transcriptional regulator [Actinoplanes lutulentus]
MRLQILGPLRLWRDGAESHPLPRQQAHLLAALLVSAGQPVSTAELIDLVWADEDVPASALNILQKYVGELRRLLEPSLPARESGSYLQRHGNGYLFDAAPDVLDLLAFRTLVAGARAATGERSLDSYAEALGLWHGPAGSGLTPNAAFAGLNGEFFDACVAATGIAVELGRPARVLTPLTLAASMAPLHEPVQASLILALAASGQQAEALSVFEAVRLRLADELGVLPGPALRAAHQRVLRPAQEPASAAAKAPRATHGDGLVGRIDEARIVGSTLAGGIGLVLVEGEPGVGKTRLLEETTRPADRHGTLVVWGRCLEGAGTPSMWPWVQVIEALIDSLPQPAREKRLAGELGRLVRPGHGVQGGPLMPDSGAQFRLFEEATAVVGEVATRQPVVLVFDDLQWADSSSLLLLSHLAARLPRRTVLIGALRNRAPVPGSELTRFLAAASRLPGHRRIRLGPLVPDEVAELVRRETGRNPTAGVAARIHARTAGNPFFVRELTRLLATDQGVITAAAATRAEVPSTVRDVVHDRMAGLDDDATALLQIAALVGRNVELGLLAHAAGLDARTCLARLEPAEALVLLGPAPGDPFSLRFAHDLVRESVAAATPSMSAPRLHLRLADALEHTAPGAYPERLAHHLLAAGPLAEPARTAVALVRAGSNAAAKSALEAAERQLRSATQVARMAGLAELELSALKQLAAVVGMRSLYGGAAALDLLERAEHLARGLGREREAADFLFSRWAGYAQTIELDRAEPLAQQLYEQVSSPDPTIRAYGLNAWGIHQWDIGNIGQGVRYLEQAGQTLAEYATRREDDPLRHDLQMLPAGIFAEMTAQHGDLGTAQMLLDALEATAGDDPYMITVWASMAARIAANAGDPAAALRAAERGIAADPEFTFVFMGTYQRLARHWAQAMTGQDPAGAADRAERLVLKNLLDPPRSCVATWFGLLAEARLAAGQLDLAAAALDRAEWALDTFGQRYPEGLILLIRARLSQARGEPAAVVRAAAERARSVSVTGEAHLYARRAEKLLAGEY